MAEGSNAPVDFIRERVQQDLLSGKHREVVTRFPPEPNGFLHIGHAKAICINFEIAAQYGGRCHLRFDDTNPTKENAEYVEGIQRDVRWLGYEWGKHLYFASDYFERIYELTEGMIRKGRAYVCDLSPDEIRVYRGTLTEPGRNSPYRERSVDENLDLFRRMRAGEFDEGARVLRARIDMASGNLNLRDPVLYRIQKTPHYRTGERWCIYPTYDHVHPLSDALEGVTHSLCDITFDDHRPLYDWVIEMSEVACRPQQIEFGRMSMAYTMTSKRKLRELVAGGHVSGWDDPRMPTLAGMRRRGYTPEAIRSFIEGIGVARRTVTIEVPRLEHSIREDLNRRAPRALAVLRPLRLVIENYPEGQVEELEAVNNPEDPAAGKRLLPFSRELYIEQEDFHPDPPKDYFRLAPGREVRLRYGYLVTCTGYDLDVGLVRCRYDPATRGGNAPDGRRVKSTIHWVSAAHALRAEVRLYSELFAVEEPELDEDFIAKLNPSSLEVLRDCRIEPSLADAEPGAQFQFERLGYFCVDPERANDAPVFNRTVTLRDTWAKVQRREGRG
jgi:glutaminyl-tRNA synthetase